MARVGNILVLGASGMLGSAVRDALASHGWHVDCTQRTDRSRDDYLDVLETPPAECSRALRRRDYSYVVNCIGLLKDAVREQELTSVWQAIRVNALFPHELANTMKDSRIIHVSSDGVFSGASTNPYVENDPTDCPDTYGKTKALGECPAPNVLNIRCSIIGRNPRGKGLIEWLLRSPEGSELMGFEDQLWNGVTTRQYAELCRRIIETDRYSDIREESGVHHFCPNPSISKYDLLCLIRHAADRKLSIRRGQSGAPSRRILRTTYGGLRAIYPDCLDWQSVIEAALPKATDLIVERAK